MISKYRTQFNELFSDENYLEFQNSIASDFDYLPTFRMAESPFLFQMN